MKINICCSSSSSITWKSVNCLSQTGSAQFSLSLHRVVNKARSSSHLQIISVSCCCSQRKAALSCYCAASQPGEGWGRRGRTHVTTARVPSGLKPSQTVDPLTGSHLYRHRAPRRSTPHPPRPPRHNGSGSGCILTDGQ